MIISNPLIEINQLRHCYDNRQSLFIESCLIPENQRIALIGPSGSGKSTFLRLLGGLEQAGSGSMHFRKNRIAGSDEVLIPGHAHIQYLHQQPQLKNHYRVSECIEYAGHWSAAEYEQYTRIFFVNDLLDRWTDELSGGEKQRIALVVALSHRPDLLLLDEPFAQLDQGLKQRLMHALETWQVKTKGTIMLATHDPLEAMGWSDSIMVLQNGMIVQSGLPLNIYRNPCNEIVAGLLGPYQILPADWFNQNFDVEIDKKFQQVVCRPDSFFIEMNVDATDKIACVRNVRNLGPYCLIQVELKGIQLQLSHVGQLACMPGDFVSIGFKDKNLGFL